MTEVLKQHFEEFLTEKGLGDKSKTGYRIIHNKLIDKLDKGLLLTDEDAIINEIRNLNFKASTKAKYLLIPILYRNHYKISKEKIGDEMKLMKQQETLDSRVKNTELKSTGITKTEILSHLDDVGKEIKLYLKKAQPNDKHLSKLIRYYIINYLIVTYGVRNMDLDLLITDDKVLIKNMDDNYLLVRANDILYIRNKYKTVSAYGPQHHIIKDNILKKCCRYLLGQRLLQTLSGTKMINIARYIGEMTYKNLGEGRLYKIMIDDTQEGNSSLNKIEKLSQSRGSNMNEVVKYYHIDKK